ncbi:MAG: Ethylene-responsive transcription factor 12, partial [Cercozoa sp. M6MM]
MISLIVPPGGQLAKVVQKLQEEYGTATNIKSRVNRQSVLAAITTAQERVKRFNTVPTNGLVVYTGEVTLPDGKTKMFAKYFEPFKPINTSLYYCDSRFHTEALEELLSNDQKYGFIVMDGNGTLFGELCGNSRKILQQISVQLPKKHGRGGQSAQRFGRIRQEKRHNYVRKVGEAASLNFIDQKTNKSTVSGIVLAGSAAFKTALYESEHFDQRLKDQVITVVHTSYGGENGFNQAIELAAEALSDVKLVAEKKLISKFMSEIAQDTGKVCFGLSDTLIALENGAAETLIVWEELEVNRYELRNPSTGETVIKHLRPEQERDTSNFVDKDGVHLDIVDQMPFLEWLANNYTKWGATLEFVTDRSSEGHQFCRGFGGLGALMRYSLNFED